jgi:hypothetical protein
MTGMMLSALYPANPQIECGAGNLRLFQNFLDASMKEKGSGRANFGNGQGDAGTSCFGASLDR